MNRIHLTPRENWQQKVEKSGLVYHTPNGRPYWDESVCYHFSSREINELEAATEEVQKLCLAAAQFVIDQNRFDQFSIPEAARPAIRAAWEAEPPSIYGRFDFAYDGEHPPKLLEYNANTPTGLLEASVIQWEWRQEVFPATDQFNSIHDKLVAKWTDLRRYWRGNRTVYFTSMRDDEDLLTVSYLRDTAQLAGLATEHLFVREIGWNEKTGTFRDLQDRPIQSIFALYPWEWLLRDMAKPVLSSCGQMDWIEPIWKMLWSNKALLAILWEMFPNHPNLLASYLDGPHGLSEFVRKPLLSREGANITVHKGGSEASTAGPYGEEGFVFQDLAPERSWEGMTPVFGSWYITDMGAAGVGIREAAGVTDNLSRFVPHYFD
jgi:glutathionylspermidine synthase